MMMMVNGDDEDCRSNMVDVNNNIVEFKEVAMINQFKIWVIRGL